MHPKLKATPGLYLVGYMGCGKSRIGRRLAERLGWDFIDLDDEVEQAAGKPISELFAEQGEERFRELEAEALARQTEHVLRGWARVMALGGGAFTFERNRLQVADRGLSVWLDVPLEELWRRVAAETHRPLARDRDAFVRRFHERQRSYGLADFRVDADAPPDDVVERVLAFGLV